MFILIYRHCRIQDNIYFTFNKAAILKTYIDLNILIVVYVIYKKDICSYMFICVLALSLSLSLSLSCSWIILNTKKCLEIPKGESEVVIRRTTYTMAKRMGTDKQTMWLTNYRKLYKMVDKLQKSKKWTLLKRGMNSGAPEVQAASVPLVVPFMLLVLTTTWSNLNEGV